MERVSAPILEILKDLGLEREATLDTVRTKWSLIVGEPVASHTLPFSHHRGHLIINVDSPEWLHELRYLQQAILDKLKPFGFEAVRLKLGSVRKCTPRPPQQRGMKAVTPEERRFIEEITSGVKDPSMRECIQRAMESSLSLRK